MKRGRFSEEHTASYAGRKPVFPLRSSGDRDQTSIGDVNVKLFHPSLTSTLRSLMPRILQLGRTDRIDLPQPFVHFLKLSLVMRQTVMVA